VRKFLVIDTVVLIVVAVAVGLYLLRQDELGMASAPTAPSVPDAAVTAGDWYDLYFTKPIIPDDARQHRDGMDERLVDLIGRAQKTVDVADYDFDLDNVASALASASKRGVRVRFVTDSDTVSNTRNQPVQSALGKLKAAGITIVEDRRPAIMHDKYTIVDGEWVATGSWNYTDGDTYRLNNWMGVFHSRDLATQYTADFASLVAGKFGPAKAGKGPNEPILIGGSRVQSCFAPNGKCGNLIAETIRREARSSIYFLAFSFTHDEIGQAIIDKAASGVKVGGVFETTGSQTQYSEFGRMKKAGLDVYTDGNPYTMHHKVIVVDERIVLAGSFNFSSNADRDNDENLLVIENPAIAKAFKAEYDRSLFQIKG
jgi:phosphatidylserine/phosphatidylglycerophosphate/cardiolipin synthase-like enzyme